MSIFSRTAPLILAALLAASLAGPALAHAHLKTAMPAPGATVSAAPPELDLSFSEGLDLAFTGVMLSGPDKTAVTTGPARLGTGGDTVLVVPLLAALPPGAYTVDWHALSTDGHKTKGRYGFTVKP